MSSKKSSSSGTRKVKGKENEPVSEIGQIPFALCEIVAKAEAAERPDIALLADSMLNVIIGCRSLEILMLPQGAKEEIAATIARYQKGAE
jgi:hypothetical protein